MRILREGLGLSRAELAIALGFQGTRASNVRAMARFENNERPIPKSVARLLYMYAKFGVPKLMLRSVAPVSVEQYAEAS